MLGMAALPQVTMRVFTLSDRRGTRTAMRWALGQTAGLYALLGVVGLGASAVVGGVALRAADPSGAMSVLALTQALDHGGLLLTAVACATFLTLLSAVASITLAAAIAVTHDIYAQVRRRSELTEGEEIRAARRFALGIGAAAVLLAAWGADVDMIVLPTLASALVASALAPVLGYSLLWPRFTARGALWCCYGGSLSALALIVVSPYFSGSPAAVFPGVDFHLTSLHTPGVVSVPIGFLLGWLGSVTDPRSRSAAAEFARLEGEALLQPADA
jgi:cation/acetate symporter